MVRICIVIVNWNGWQDTIECLESLFKSSYRDFTVCVCDNASTDNSLDHIEEWARGDRMSKCQNSELERLSVPPVPKPLPFVRVGSGMQLSSGRRVPGLILLESEVNLGFAGGNNAAFRLLQRNGECDYVWFLNNDTVVEPDALASLVRKMEEQPKIGICGSTLIYYDDPETVQALGGSTYNRWIARAGHLGAGLRRGKIPEAKWAEQRMQYVVGASMFVRKQFLHEVGLMDERYFLYFEEIDWAVRAGRGRFRLGYCPASIVYHKEGAAIGSAHRGSRRSTLSEFYTTRNRVLFTRKFFPYAIAPVCMAIAMSGAWRLISGNTEGLKSLVRGVVQGFTQN